MRHLEGWLRAAAEIDRDNEYFLLPPKAVPTSVAQLPRNFRWEPRGRAPRFVPARLLWEQTWVAAWLGRRRIDVLFSTADRTVLAAPCPTVLLIQNLNPYEGPRAASAVGRAREVVLAALTRLSARGARHVVFVSEYSRTVICQALEIPPAKTSVVYHGVDGRFLAAGEMSERAATARRAGASATMAPYVLNVSVVRRHKNLTVLIDGFAIAARSGDLQPLELRVAAPVIEHEYERVLRARVASHGIDARVRFLGVVPTERLVELYRDAAALVFTSLTETFGLPLVEAMASGTPVLASRIPTATEICGDAALYFDPADPEDLASGLRELLLSDEVRARLRERGISRAREFSWPRAATQTLGILQNVATSSSGTRQGAQPSR